MVTIIPAILARNLQEFEERFKRVMGLVKKVHVDVIDGVFAPTKTIRPEELSVIDTMVEFDMHLMVDEPRKWVGRCVQGGATRVFGQVEKMSDQAGFIADAQVAGLAVGLALDLETSVKQIESVIHELDAVLLLAVKAGESGQEFQSQVLAKVEEVRQLRDDIIIVIDGGVDEQHIKEVFAAEWKQEEKDDELRRNFLDVEFAVASHLFDQANIEAELENLQHLKSHE